MLQVIRRLLSVLVVVFGAGMCGAVFETKGIAYFPVHTKWHEYLIIAFITFIALGAVNWVFADKGSPHND